MKPTCSKLKNTKTPFYICAASHAQFLGSPARRAAPVEKHQKYSFCLRSLRNATRIARRSCNANISATRSPQMLVSI